MDSSEMRRVATAEVKRRLENYDFLLREMQRIALDRYSAREARAIAAKALDACLVKSVAPDQPTGD